MRALRKASLSSKRAALAAALLLPREQRKVGAQAGDVMYQQHKFVPLFWLPTEASTDPKVVAGWDFPGSISGSWTHVEYLRAAK